MKRPLALPILLAAVFLRVPPAAGADTLELLVDASEAPRRVFHAHLVIPASAGPMAFSYPKWIPGEHGPTGPIADLAGLRFEAAGAPLAWTRDPEDMYTFRVDVPSGATTVEIALDYLSPSVAEGFSSGASATDVLAVLNWNQVVVYPQGASADAVQVAARLRLPAGWSFATALPSGSGPGDTVVFRTASLATLVDSPVLMGRYMRELDLSPGSPSIEKLHLAADSAAALEIGPERLEAYRRLVSEEIALFGARHYREYHFLLALSDQVAQFGLEHHESSENRAPERTFLDQDHHRKVMSLLAHEFFHSWNGKYRRATEMISSDFAKPIRTGMLWLYEGLTNYYGDFLSARAGVMTRQEFLERIALYAGRMERQTGRTWRPLEDTAVSAQILYEARDDWAHWRRGVDFYLEGDLIWLEADAIIRRATSGRRSLDDFCRRFYGEPAGPPEVRGYTLEDVLAALRSVADHDWAGWLKERLTTTSAHAPLEGLRLAGWRLAYTDRIPAVLESIEEVDETTDAIHSIGVLLDKAGVFVDVVPGLPAAKSGIAPGMRLVAVNGRKWSPEVLRLALGAAKKSSDPLELLVENHEFYRTFRLDYHEGERYPRLERLAGTPDLLTAIIAPRATARVPGSPARSSRKSRPGQSSPGAETHP